MKRFALLFLFLMGVFSSSVATPPGLSGTLKIGPGKAYPTLTAAITALVREGVSGPVILELQSDYTSFTESYPISIPAIPGAGEASQITIRPAANARSLFIRSLNFSGTLELNSVSYLNIDGRPGGVGTSSQLRITCDQQTFPAIAFKDACSHNNIRYTEVTASMINGESGIINMTASGGTGNTYNNIENCEIHVTKGKSIYKGIASIAGKGSRNSFNTVKDCKLYDCGGYYIYLGDYNSDWQITNNDFYIVDYNSFNYSAVYITDETGSGYNITDNAIGGSAPDCSGQRPDISGLTAIWIQTSHSGFNNILRNKIANVRIITGDTFSPFVGIYMNGGNFNCTGNIVGETDNTGKNITVTYEYDGFVAGISAGGLYGSVDTCIINGNKVGGISCTQKKILDKSKVFGITTIAKAYSEIRKNYVGSAAVKNSMSIEGTTNYGLVGISATVGNEKGIPTNIVSDNFVANLKGAAAGIETSAAANYITNNTVRDLSLTVTAPEYRALYGINLNGRTPVVNNELKQVISGNVVHSLTMENVENFINSSRFVVGINVDYIPNVLVERNLVHSLASSTDEAYNKYINGISVRTSNKTTVKNNMVRVGIDAQGKSIPGEQDESAVRIYSEGADVMNNSLFVEGNGDNYTVALFISPGKEKANVYNNILVNNSTVNPENTHYYHDNYALFCDKNLSANYNDYYIKPAEKSHVVRFMDKDYDNIRAWRKASGLDSNSFVYAPNFKNAGGDASVVDLHIAGPSAVKGAGSYDSSVAEDFDGEKRDPSSPDIGADAGNYAYQDGEAPILTHEDFIGQPVKSNYTYRVRIVDKVGGIDATTGKAPRMWLRKSYPEKGNWFSVEGKQLSGNAIESIWGFRPDLSKAGATLSPGDSLEYYFVAQDKGPVINVGYSNIDSTSHTDVNTQLNAPVKPLRLIVYGLFPDTVYVGTGQQYTSLSNEDGFFQATSSMSFDTTKENVYVIITSDLLEKGFYPMNNITKSSCKITICTNTAVQKIISNENLPGQRPMLTLSKVNNLTIDGRVGGAGRYLRFQNLDMMKDYETTAMTIYGASEDITFTHLEFATNNTYYYGSIYFGGEMKRLLIEDNLFTDIPVKIKYREAGLPRIGIRFAGINLDSVTIRNNDFSNFSVNGILVEGTIAPAGQVSIDNNHFYYNSPVVNNENPVAIQARTRYGTLNITNNNIGGSARFCGGTRWPMINDPDKTREGKGYFFTGIDVANTGGNVSIQGNIVSQVAMPPFGSFRGILAIGDKVYIGNEEGNRIGKPGIDSSVFTGRIAGISVDPISTEESSTTAIISNNIFTNIHATGHLEAIMFDDRELIARKNQIFSVSCGEGKIFKLTLTKGIISENVIRDCKFEDKIWNAYATVIAISQLWYTSSTGELVVERNKISNLLFNNATSVIGIKADNTNALFKNNQVSIGTNSSNIVELRGLYFTGDVTRKATNRILNNTVYLWGQSSDAAGSSGIYIEDVNAQQQFMNNIIYNNRSGGTGRHLALYATSADLRTFAETANNNLYITSGEALNKLGTITTFDMERWRLISATDDASYAASVTAIPPSELFRSVDDNLDINTASASAWLVNGKGMPVKDVYDDFSDSSHVRSVMIATGATDIGADEFSTSTTPPALTVLGDHIPGGTETMLYNGRVIASLTWGTGGTLPVLDTPRFYSGEWPKDATNNGTITTARFMNGYWDIGATGGSNYSYSLTLSYDSSMLGMITDVSNMVVNKREPGVSGSWKALTPSVVDTLGKTVTIYNQTSFSEFTLTDSLATATKPAQLADIQLVTDGAAQTRSNTVYDLRYKEANIGSGYSLAHKVLVYLSKDDQLTPEANGDSLLGTLNAGRIAAGANFLTDKLALKFGCELQPGQYYIIAQADPENTFPESDKSNNISRFRLQLLPAGDVSFSSDKVKVCAGEMVSFTASGADKFTFSGTSVSNVKDLSFEVNTTAPGKYTYTATTALNGCTVLKSVDITVNDNPQVTVTGLADAVCEGQKTTLTASGASSYVWRGENVFYTGKSFEPMLSGAGTYSFMLTGTDQNGCKGTTTTTISTGSVVTPSVSIDYSGCPGRVLSFQAYPVNGGDLPQYKWYVNDQLKGTGANFTLNKPENSMEVYVTMNSSAPCTDEAEVSSAPTKINCVITAIPEIDGMEAFSIYPNPGEGLFYVRTKLNTAKQVKLLIADGTGNVIMVIPSVVRYGEVVIPVDLRNKPNGLYYIQATIGNKTFTNKVIKL